MIMFLANERITESSLLTTTIVVVIEWAATDVTVHVIVTDVEVATAGTGDTAVVTWSDILRNG